MKKYLEIGKATWKSMTAYRADVLTGAAFSFCRILLAFLMWEIIFKSHAEVGGYNFSEMMTYYVITSLLGRLDQSNSLLWQFSGEIRDGRFGKYMVRPLKPMFYFISSCYARTAYVLGVNAAATAVWAVVFSGLLRAPADPGRLLTGLLVFLLGMNFTVLFNYFISILSFKFINISGLNILKQNFVEFLSGALIPLSILPSFAAKAISLLPFCYTAYYPASLYLGKDPMNPAAAIALMLFWNCVMLAACALFYRKQVKSFEGVGI